MNLANDMQAIYNLLAPITKTLTRSFEDSSEDVIIHDEAIYVQRMECEFGETDGTDAIEATYTYQIDVYVERAAGPDDRAAVLLQSVLSALAGALIGTIPLEVRSWERVGTEKNTQALYNVRVQFTRMEVL